MSIVTFDGHVLAADSRKTVHVRTKSGERQFLRKTDEQVKIELFDGRVTFRGENIEAVGRCGNLKLSTAIIEDLKSGYKVESRWKVKTRLANYANPASVLIVTDQNAYHFRVSPKTGVEVTVLEKKPFAMGSGKEVAMFLMDTFKLPACEAAMAVTLKFKSCGGAINVLKRDRWTGRLQLADAKCADGREERRVMVATAILRCVGRLKTRSEEKIATRKVTPPPGAEDLLQAVFEVSGTKPAKKKVKSL